MLAREMIKKLQDAVQKYGDVSVEMLNEHDELYPVEAVWYIESDAINDYGNAVSPDGPTIILGDKHLFAPTQPVRIK